VSADQKEIAKLKSIAKEFPYDVKFFEKLGENEKMCMFWNAKLVVYPQIVEWIGGMSIIEGMSVKTPGICFDYPVLRELYGDCTIYAKPKNFMDLREKIKLLYEDEYLNRELAVKGYERFKRYFTREVMAGNLIGVLSGTT
jgi:glycosyltransferase involved in cell wall biosynthesis